MIILRESAESDVLFVAKCVMAAAGIATLESIENGGHDKTLGTMAELCGSEWSLYWYRLAIIAEDTETGRPAGCILAYDGARYAKARELTFSYAEERLGISMASCGVETVPGEYYLDTMAILPEYRGMNIGLKLMEAAVERGMKAGLKRFTLIADKNAPRLRAYYGSIGFKEAEEVDFLGHPYIRMVRQY